MKYPELEGLDRSEKRRLRRLARQHGQESQAYLDEVAEAKGNLGLIQEIADRHDNGELLIITYNRSYYKVYVDDDAGFRPLRYVLFTHGVVYKYDERGHCLEKVHVDRDELKPVLDRAIKKEPRGSNLEPRTLTPETKAYEIKEYFSRCDGWKRLLSL